MDVIKYLQNKYKIDISGATSDKPIEVPMGRTRDVPYMFRRLGFKRGAEIGVYRGSYANALLRRIPGLKLYCVDTWEDYDGYSDFNMFPPGHMEESYQEAKKNVEGFDCELIRASSVEAAKQIPDESLDFVFIDANHAYEWVVQDIAIWSKKVRKGGVIYGHDYTDYTHSKRWYQIQVIPAVDGWMKAYKIKPWFVITNNKYNCWMYVK